MSDFGLRDSRGRFDEVSAVYTGIVMGLLIVGLVLLVAWAT